MSRAFALIALAASASAFVPAQRWAAPRTVQTATQQDSVSREVFVKDVLAATSLVVAGVAFPNAAAAADKKAAKAAPAAPSAEDKKAAEKAAKEAAAKKKAEEEKKKAEEAAAKDKIRRAEIGFDKIQPGKAPKPKSAFDLWREGSFSG